MARVLGDSARYVASQAVRQRRQLTTIGAVIVGLICGLSGVFAGYLLQNKQLTVTLVTFLLVLDAGAIWGILKVGLRKLDELEKKRIAMRKGATGEAAVAATLGDFPDEFYVINDLTTQLGNVDHVVIGPTRVFVIDTKNWRGVVSGGGNGELLWNGKPTEKPMVRAFTARLMGIKEQVRGLSGCDPYFHGLFVFTSARVDANWGMTGAVHCLRDDQLFDYIVERKNRHKLNRKQIESIAQAFLALARMDKDFEVTSIQTDNTGHFIADLTGLPLA